MPTVEKGFRAHREKAGAMKLKPKLLLALAVVLSVGVCARSQEVACGEFQAYRASHAPDSSSIPTVREPSALRISPTVTHYVTQFDGDHSLKAATVVEQTFARYTLYTVRLKFGSGVEQSVVLTAPPGGLQPEMRDMSGDSVPNDLVLTSKLLGLPLIVLLNEGHDHLTVAISPGSFTDGEGRASGPHQTHRASALVSPRFSRGGLTNCEGPHYPRLEETLRSPLVSQSTRDVEHLSASGRAPPAFVTALLRAA